MPFNTLLLSGCLLTGQTSFKENKASVSIQPQFSRGLIVFYHNILMSLEVEH